MGLVTNSLYIAGVVVLVHASALLSGGPSQLLHMLTAQSMLRIAQHETGIGHPICDTVNPPSPPSSRNTAVRTPLPPPPPPPGLTLGLLSLDPLELQVQSRSGSKAQQRRAARLLPLVARTHQVGPLPSTQRAPRAVSACCPILNHSEPAGFSCS